MCKVSSGHYGPSFNACQLFSKHYKLDLLTVLLCQIFDLYVYLVHMLHVYVSVAKNIKISEIKIYEMTFYIGNVEQFGEWVIVRG